MWNWIRNLFDNRVRDEDGQQVCASCEEGECARFDIDPKHEDLAEDQQCCICDPDSDICGFCRSMM